MANPQEVADESKPQEHNQELFAVCVKPFLKEVNRMQALLKGIGRVKDEIATYAATQAQAAQVRRP